MTGARLTFRQDMVTIALSTWMVVGLFLDGWAHGNRPQLETFFTWWHAFFYAGFTAVALWITWLVRRQMRAGRRGRDALPLGYGLGVIGLGIFFVGGVGDLIWHTVFGIEVDIEQLLSPTHLTLLLGGFLILTCPLRAAWSMPGREPTLGRFMPALISLTLAKAGAAFFLVYLWAPFSGAPLRSNGTGEALGIASVLVSNFILMGPALYALRRWLLPPGSLTILFSSTSVLVASLDGFEFWQPSIALVVGGVAGDIMVRRLRPSSERVWAFRAVAGLIPLVLWTSYFIVLEVSFGLGWAVELWSGTILFAVAGGVILAYLMLPSPVPESQKSALSPVIEEREREFARL